MVRLNSSPVGVCRVLHANLTTCAWAAARGGSSALVTSTFARSSPRCN